MLQACSTLVDTHYLKLATIVSWLRWYGGMQPVGLLWASMTVRVLESVPSCASGYSRAAEERADINVIFFHLYFTPFGLATDF